MNQYPIDVEPREFSCFDDCPENTGWGYNQVEREEDDNIDDSDYTGEED